MAKIKFKKHYRFDAEKAKNGVAHHIIDDVGNDYGTFTTSLFDPFNKFILVETERFNRENADKVKAMGDKAHIYAFVEVCLHDWSGVLDEEDKEVPFTKEGAFDYLSDDDNAWLWNKLAERTQDVLRYQSDPDATKAAIAGN